MKMKKLEKKLSKLKEKKDKSPNERLEKKIMKLEKKKVKLEKWLQIKLPFRILITIATTWLILAGVVHASSYIPLVKEVKTIAMGAIAYVAPEPVLKVLDVATLNIGASNNNFEWLETTLKAYLNNEIEIKTNNVSTGWSVEKDQDGSYIYHINNVQVSEEEYNSYRAELEDRRRNKQNEIEDVEQEVFGTKDITSMSISEIIMKVAVNSTPELVSRILDTTDLTSESRQQLEQDINRALRILPKLNNNQMNELVQLINDFITSENNNTRVSMELQKASEDFIEEVRATGRITSESYKGLMTLISAEENKYSMELELQSLNGNSYNTSNLNIGNNYTLKQGDIIGIVIKNASNKIVSQFSGMVISDGN